MDLLVTSVGSDRFSGARRTEVFDPDFANKQILVASFMDGKPRGADAMGGKPRRLPHEAMGQECPQRTVGDPASHDAKKGCRSCSGSPVSASPLYSCSLSSSLPAAAVPRPA